MIEDFIKNLLTHIQDNYKSIGEFERKNFLKRNSVNDIISSNNKNPSMKNALAIANAMDCSLDELFGREKHKTHEPSSSLDNSNSVISKELLERTSVFVSNAIENNQLKDVDAIICINAINKICLYCSENNHNKFDPKFASWYMKNNF